MKRGMIDMIKRLIVGVYQSNCYIITIDKEAVIIDPGDQGNKIDKYLKEHELQVLAILLTHGHIDHIGATDYLVANYHCPVYIHHEDIPFIDDVDLNLSNSLHPYVMKAKINQITKDLKINSNFNFIFHHLPGHTPGSCMIEWLHHNIVFSGDVLFKGSIGRYDLPQGSHYDTKVTLEKLKLLNPEWIIKPGHGDETTLKEELRDNPFLKS